MRRSAGAVQRLLLRTALSGPSEACTPAGIVQYMDSNFGIDVDPVLPLVQAPTLVLHGTRDQIIPFFFAELFQRADPRRRTGARRHGSWRLRARGKRGWS